MIWPNPNPKRATYPHLRVRVSRDSLPHDVTLAWVRSLCKVAAIDCLSRPLQFVVFRQSNAFWVADALMLYVRFAVSYVLLQPLACVSINQTSFRAGA